MSGRLYVSNFGFEDELSGETISRTARAATMGLCGVWAPMLGPSDQIASWGGRIWSLGLLEVSTMRTRPVGTCAVGLESSDGRPRRKGRIDAGYPGFGRG